MASESVIVPTVVFSVAAFIGNFGVAITGFGMAVFFLFVYTIADFAGLECSRCDIRDAIFYQTLALGSAVPLLLFQSRSNIKEHWNKELLVTFIPATIVGTPIGNFLQDHLPSDILRTVVGALVTAVLFYELTKIVPSSGWYQKLRNPNLSDQEKEAEDSEKCPSDNVSTGKDLILNNSPKVTDVELQKIPNPEAEYDDRQDVKSDIEPNSSITDSFVKENDDPDKDENTTNLDVSLGERKDTLPTGWTLRIWGFILGFLSGFFGGLIGVRGPPLMIFFLLFSYPKGVVRGNAPVILLVNMMIRVAYYIVEDLSGVRDSSWFEPSYSVLYVWVILSGLIGVPAGNYVASKLSEGQFKMFIAFMLLLSGLSNLIKGGISLSRN